MRGRGWLWAVWLGFACLYALSIGRGFYSSDGEVMFQSTGALVERGVWQLDADPGLPQIVAGADGAYYGKYDPGLSLLMVPFYVTGETLGEAYAAHRYALAATCALLLSALAAAGSVAGVGQIAYGLWGPLRNESRSYSKTKDAQAPSDAEIEGRFTVRLVYSPVHVRRAMLLAAGIASPLWVYGRELFPEAVLACALTWAVVDLAPRPPLHPVERGRRLDCLRVLFAGIAFGVGIMTRAALAIYLPALVWVMWRRARPDWKSFVRQGVAFGVGVAPFVGIVLWHNALRFGGDPLRFGYAGERFTTPVWEGIAGLLFSPGKSVFVYAPPLLLSVMLWPRFRRMQPALAEFLVLAWGSALLFYGAWWAWDGGWCWGPRLLVPLLSLSMLPLVALPQGLAWRIALVLLIVLGAGINLLGVLVDVVPLYAEVAPEEAADVDAVNWSPRDAPVVWAAGRVWDGHTEPLGMFRLDDTGLPPLWSRGVPVGLVAGLVLGVFVMRRPARRRLKVEIEQIAQK